MEDLLNRIEELENWKKSLETSPTIPLNIDQAFRARFLGSGVAVTATGTGSATTQNKSLSGNPETITVPAQPSGTLKVTYRGATYELLYK